MQYTRRQARLLLIHPSYLEPGEISLVFLWRSKNERSRATAKLVPRNQDELGNFGSEMAKSWLGHVQRTGDKGHQLHVFSEGRAWLSRFDHAMMVRPRSSLSYLLLLVWEVLLLLMCGEQELEDFLWRTGLVKKCQRVWSMVVAKSSLFVYTLSRPRRLEVFFARLERQLKTLGFDSSMIFGYFWWDLPSCLWGFFFVQ